jgi:heat shock protein HslJ
MQPSQKNISQDVLHLLGGAVILISLIFAAGCTGQQPESRVNGTDWILKGYVQNGTPAQALTGTKITLDFGDDGRITGSAGCNRYFASYEMKGTAITIGPAGSTMMYCGTPGVMDQESAYLTLLNQAETFTLQGDRLSIFDAKGIGILSFAKTILPKPKPLVGTNWTLESIYTVNAVSSVITDTTITAVFGDDGRVSGSAGCNRFFAQYNLTGTSLSIGQAGSTRMVCDTSGIMNQENTYLNHLKSTRSFTIVGNQLALLDESGGRILTFSANT